MNIKKILMILSILAIQTSVHAFDGTEYIDDQTILDSEAKQLVNPRASARDFIKSNNSHRILIANIGSGVDYNHPHLVNSIHFNLDKSGKAIGTGYDFVGKDAWPAPYIGNSSKSYEGDYAGNRFRWLSKYIFLVLQKIEKESKDYLAVSSSVNMNRRLDLEYETYSGLGTVTTGLIVHNTNQIGVIPYRTRLNPTMSHVKSEEKDFEDSLPIVSFDEIVKASEDAIQKGARIIFLPSSLNVSRDFVTDPKKQDKLDFLNKAADAELSRMKTMIDNNPGVVFIAPVGNDGKWIDGLTNRNVPCSLDSPNILCVGHLAVKNKISSKTNIVLSNTPFVLASGVNTVSTWPTNTCTTDLTQLQFGYNRYKAGGYFYPNDVPVTLCKPAQFIRTGGNALAAARVARKLGLLFSENLNLSGSEIVQKFLGKSKVIELGPNVGIPAVSLDEIKWKGISSSEIVDRYERY